MRELLVSRVLARRRGTSADKVDVEPSNATHPARTPSLWPLAAVCLIVAIVSRLTYALRPWDPDGAIFIYMGKVVAEGGVFWRDIVDNKLPTVGFLTSSAWRLFGDWWLGYILLQTTLALIACLALGRAARTLAGDRAWWPTVLFALVYLNFNTIVFGGFQLETLHIVFASLAAMPIAHLLAHPPTHRSAFLCALAAGLCAGCAALAKPTGLSVLAALSVALLLQFRAWRRLLAIAAGTATGLAIVAGAVGIYLHQTGTLDYLPQTLAQIALYARNSATDLRDLNKIIWAAGVIGFPLLATWWTTHRRTPASSTSCLRATVPSCLPFAFAWLAIELLGVILQKRMYGYHFLVLAPPAALIFGLIARTSHPTRLAMALAPALLLSVIGIGQVLIYSRGYQQRLQSGQWLLAHASPGDLVWRDMTSRLLIETDLRPGSRYLLTFLFCNADHAPQQYWAEMRHEFDQRRPRWMVLPRDLPAYLNDTTTMVAELERLPHRRQNYLRAWSELESYIHTNYRLVATLDKETVWERHDRATQRASAE